MKTIVSIFVLVLFSQSGLAQNEKSIARVSKVNGIPVYIYNEPLNEYDVVTSKGTGGKTSSLLTDGLVNEGISGKVSQYVQRLTKEAKKKGFEFDAILYTKGKQASAIKFKDNFDQEKKDLAMVKTLNGVLIFTMCEPVETYSIEVDKSGGAKVGSYLTSGIANKSIEGDLNQFSRRIKKEAKNENKQVDAIIYSTGKRAIGIKFN